MIETSAVALFMAGLLGGLHCAGMCGGIVAALSVNHAQQSQPGRGGVAFGRAPASDYSAVFKTQLLYNVGRLMTYGLLGAAAGASGSVLNWIDTALPVQQIAFAMTNLTLLLVGAYLLGLRHVNIAMESVGKPFWRMVRPFASRQLGSVRPINAVAAGSLWGLVPCGLVYAALIAALFSGGALKGAVLMLAFGLGTLPNLLIFGISSQCLQRGRRQVFARRFVGAAIVIFAILGLLRLEALSPLTLLQQVCFPLSQ